MGYFDPCLYFSGNKFARHMTKIAEEAFENMDITPTQGFTLILISEKNKHSPSEIAAELEMDPSTITRFLDKLEKLGYIEREYLGRKTEVKITESGKKEVSEIFKCWEELSNTHLKLLGEETSEKLTKEIMKANKILTKRGKKTGTN